MSVVAGPAVRCAARRGHGTPAMMRRPGAVALVVGVLLALGTPALSLAQSSRPPFRIGVVREQPSTDPQFQAFVGGLREQGWVEGRTILIEYLRGEVPQFPELVQDLVRRKVDLIFAPNPQQARAAREATATIPIVFAVVGDPVRTGLVKSLARPGGNVTGMTGLGSDLGPKRLELLKALIPGLTRVAVLWNPGVPDKVVEWEQMQEPARALRLDLRSIEVRASGDFPAALEAIERAKPDGLILLPEPLTFAQRKPVIDFARRARVPAIFAWRQAVEAGALLSYGPDVVDLYRRAALYVDKILKGAKPAELPVEQPAKFELVVNLRTARALDLTVPPSLLLRADQVIE